MSIKFFLKLLIFFSLYSIDFTSAQNLSPKIQVLPIGLDTTGPLKLVKAKGNVSVIQNDSSEYISKISKYFSLSIIGIRVDKMDGPEMDVKENTYITLLNGDEVPLNNIEDRENFPLIKVKIDSPLRAKLFGIEGIYYTYTVYYLKGFARKSQKECKNYDSFSMILFSHARGVLNYFSSCENAMELHSECLKETKSLQLEVAFNSKDMGLQKIELIGKKENLFTREYKNCVLK